MSATLDHEKSRILQIFSDSFSLHFLFHFVRFTLLNRREIIFLNLSQSEMLRIFKVSISYRFSEFSLVVWRVRAWIETESNIKSFWLFMRLQFWLLEKEYQIWNLKSRCEEESLNFCVNWKVIEFTTKLCYCHKLTVDYVELPQEHSLKVNELLMSWKDFHTSSLLFRRENWEYSTSVTYSIFLSHSVWVQTSVLYNTLSFLTIWVVEV